MGLIIKAAVDDCRKGCDLLDHRAGKALSESTGRKFHLMHGCAGVDNAGRFIRQIDAGKTPEIKILLIGAEGFYLQFHADLHKRIIARIYDGVLKGLIPVPVNVVAVNRCIGDELTTVTVESIFIGYGFNIQIVNHT